MQVQIGLDTQDKKKITDELGKLLAETYSVYLKTQNYHWNVKGVHFPGLHKLFEEHYGLLAEAIDVIAERIVILGYPAPGSFEEFSRLSELEAPKVSVNEAQMIEDLLTDHEHIIRRVRLIFDASSDAGDEGTADLLAARLREHEKMSWMLRSMTQ